MAGSDLRVQLVDERGEVDDAFRPMRADLGIAPD